MALNEAATPSERRDRPSATRSFSRMDTPEPVSRSRSNTVQDVTAGGVPASNAASFLSNPDDVEEGGDVFEKSAAMDSCDENGNEEVESPIMGPENLPERFDELPIELISLTDRCVPQLDLLLQPALY